MRRLLFVLVLLSPVSAFAQTGTTISTLDLKATFDFLSVRLDFTGDSDVDNSGVVEFKKSSASTWKTAYTPISDHRATVDGETNPGANEFRVSVAVFTCGTAYDVRVTVTDPDGVTGTNPATGSITTNPCTAPTSTEIWVDDSNSGAEDGSQANPWNTITEAITAASAGTKIRVMPGSYAAFTISKSGSSGSGYIAIVGEDRDTTFINGGAVTANVTVASSQSYLQFKNLRVKATNNHSFSIGSSAHHIWMENIYHENIKGNDGSCGSGEYTDSGTSLSSNVHNIYILDSTFLSTYFSTCDLGGDAWEENGSAVYVNSGGSGVHSLVFRGNTVHMPCRDGIGGTEGDGHGAFVFDNTDILYSSFQDIDDDSIQTEGEVLNLRIVGNWINSNLGWSCSAMAPHFVGPVYVARNYCFRPSGAHANMSFKWYEAGSDGHAHVFHNSLRAVLSGGEEGVRINTGAITSRYFNNIWYHTGSGADVYNGYAAGASWMTNYTFHDYNHYQGYSNAPVETNRSTGNPLYTSSTDLSIPSSSGAYNTGVALANWNGEGSCWPNADGAPEKGAFEVNKTYVPGPSGYAVVVAACASALPLGPASIKLRAAVGGDPDQADREQQDRGRFRYARELDRAVAQATGVWLHRAGEGQTRTPRYIREHLDRLPGELERVVGLIRLPTEPRTHEMCRVVAIVRDVESCRQQPDVQRHARHPVFGQPALQAVPNQDRRIGKAEHGFVPIVAHMTFPVVIERNGHVTSAHRLLQIRQVGAAALPHAVTKQDRLSRDRPGQEQYREEDQGSHPCDWTPLLASRASEAISETKSLRGKN